MSKYDNAIADYSEVIRLVPNDAEAWRNRGLIWLLKYDDDRGIADYDQAIKLDPNDADSYNNRGQAHLSKGHRQQAIAYGAGEGRLRTFWHGQGDGQELAMTRLFNNFNHIWRTPSPPKAYSHASAAAQIDART
jgi:tetratricopeptide (TPR) repeat protein